MKQYVKTGINGLDVALHGGIPKHNTVIIEGKPGTGKTTMGIQFLRQGALQGEPGIYITFEEFPEQIEANMLDFGWNLEELKKKNLLKIVSFTPDIFVKQLMEPDGIFETMITSMECQRVVIDSLSLLKCFEGEEGENREMANNIRNSVKKYALTTLIINEEGIARDKGTPPEHFVFDGVINLFFKESGSQGNYKERCLEILKMRGTKLFNSRFNLRFLETGIHLIPPYTALYHNPDRHVDTLSTGISKLDEVLDGGITRGSIVLLETDSRSINKWAIASIASESIKRNERFFYNLPSTVTIKSHIALFEKFGIDLIQKVKEGQGFFIENFNRIIPPEIKSFVYNVTDYSNEAYWEFLNETIIPIFKPELKNGENWFLNYDVNSILLKRGEPFIRHIFGEFVSLIKDLELTCLVSCNVETLSQDIIALLEEKSDDVLRMWTDTDYQYMQIAKSLNGSLSHPYIVESSPEPPFMSLL